MFCWFVRRVVFWGGRFLRWTGVSFLRGVGTIYVAGKIKVNIQWVWYCMVYNIGKIMNYGLP